MTFLVLSCCKIYIMWKGETHGEVNSAHRPIKQTITKPDGVANGGVADEEIG